MEYSVSKTIRKELKQEAIFDVLREKFQKSGEISEQGNLLIVKGFNKNLGGINYVATVEFSVRVKENKTIINVNVTHKTSKMFWILLIVTALGFLVGAILPIGFYYYGKKMVIKEIEKGLQETKDELD